MWRQIVCVILACLSYSPSVTAQAATHNASQVTIFVCNWDPGRLLRISEVGSEVWGSQIRAYFPRPVAVDFDPVNEVIYYTDVRRRQIGKIGVYSSRQTTLVTLNRTAAPDGLAVDSVNQKLFYTDAENDLIATTNLDGRRQEILFSSSDGIDNPRAIIVDPSNRKIFWTDWGRYPYIATASYDGTNKKKIITNNLGWPNGLALDTKKNILYWCDARTDKIESSSTDGTGRTLIKYERNSHYFDIAFHEGTLYFTDWNRRAVLAMSPNGGALRNVTTSLITKPAGLHVVPSKLKGDCNPGSYNLGQTCIHCGNCISNEVCNPISGYCPNGCAAGWRGSTCKYECTSTTYGVNCSQDCGYCRSGDRCDSVTGHCPKGCNTGWKGKKCDEKDGEPEITIFVANMSPARLLSVSVAGNHVWATRINVTSRRPVAIDYDPIQKELYWTDVTNDWIGKTDMNGNRKILIRSLLTPDGLTLDIGARKLFFTDAGRDIIGTMDLNGTVPKTILRRSDGLSQPRAITLDPRNRKIFWTDWARYPYIATAKYDGTNMTKIITSGLGWPNGLALDTRRKYLFWCDARTDRIERSWIDGSHREVLYYDPTAHFFDIVFQNGFLYFTNWRQRAVLVIPENGGPSRNISAPLLFKPAGLHILPRINTECDPGAYGKYCQYFCDSCLGGTCNSTTGRCTQGCLPGWNGHKCKTRCPPKTYGPCHACGHCAGDGQCDTVSGYCPNGCQLGWKGDRCDIKCYRSYGQSCVRCGHCLYDKPCDQNTGHCTNGCALGWTGAFCKMRFNVPVQTQPVSQKITDNTAVIAGAVGGSLGLLLIIVTVIIVVAVILARRMKLRNQSHQTSQEGTVGPSRVLNLPMGIPPPYTSATSVMSGVRYITSADNAILVTNQEDGQSVMNEGEDDTASELPEKPPLPE